MVERAALEMRYTRKRIEGSNPPLSANKKGRFVCLSLLKQANRSFYLQRCRWQNKRKPNFNLSLLKCTIRIENHDLLDGASIGRQWR